MGFAAEVLIGPEVEAELVGQSGWCELGVLSGQAEMGQDLSRDGELGDASNDRERAAAVGAIQGIGKGPADQLGPGEATKARA